MRTGDNLLVKSILQVGTALKSQVFKVHIQNQKEIVFPKVQTVDFVKEIKELLKQAETRNVHIENQSPKDAVAVKLATQDGRRFYDAMLQVTGGTSLGRLQGILKPRPGLLVDEFLKDSGGSSDMNQDGSSTPITFTAQPPSGFKWFIYSVDIIIEDSSINFVKFGGRSSLTNGLEILATEGGKPERSFGIFQQNGDFHEFTHDVSLESSVTDFFRAHKNLEKEGGTTFEIASSRSENVKVIVNDNLTTITRARILVRGYEISE